MHILSITRAKMAAIPTLMAARSARITALDYPSLTRNQARFLRRLQSSNQFGCDRLIIGTTVPQQFSTQMCCVTGVVHCKPPLTQLEMTKHCRKKSSHTSRNHQFSSLKNIFTNNVTNLKIFISLKPQCITFASSVPPNLPNAPKVSTSPLSSPSPPTSKTPSYSSLNQSTSSSLVSSLLPPESPSTQPPKELSHHGSLDLESPSQHAHSLHKSLLHWLPIKKLRYALESRLNMQQMEFRVS